MLVTISCLAALTVVAFMGFGDGPGYVVTLIGITALALVAAGVSAIRAVRLHERIPKRTALVVASLVSIASVPFGWERSLTVSQWHGDWISRLGGFGLLLTIVAWTLAVARRRSRTGRSYVAVMGLAGIASLMVIPIAFLVHDISGGRERNVDVLSRLQVDLPEVKPIGFENPPGLESQEAVRVYSSDDLEQDCRALIARANEWWDGEVTGRGGPEFCSGRGDNGRREVEIEGSKGRMVVTVFTKTTDLFAF